MTKHDFLTRMEQAQIAARVSPTEIEVSFAELPASVVIETLSALGLMVSDRENFRDTHLSDGTVIERWQHVLRLNGERIGTMPAVQNWSDDTGAKIGRIRLVPAECDKAGEWNRLAAIALLLT